MRPITVEYDESLRFGGLKPEADRVNLPLTHWTVALAVCLALTSKTSMAEPAREFAAETRILKWKDGKSACFLLAFDDSAASQLKNVVPELEKRKIVGTFYLVTGNSLYASLKTKWEAAAKSRYVVVANHTFTHK